MLDTKMCTNRQFRLETKSLCSKTRLPRFKPSCINLSTLVLRLKKVLSEHKSSRHTVHGIFRL